MEQLASACRQRLSQLADSAPHDLRLQINDNGVDIELTDLQLRFRHSFLSGPIVNRAKQPNQLLLKVCNNKQRTIKKILDLTAGWGVDAYTLAHHGHHVTLLENNELMVSDCRVRRLSSADILSAICAILSICDSLTIYLV
jgi:hypothetical protein